MFASLVRTTFLTGCNIAGVVGGVLATEKFMNKVSKESFRITLKRRRDMLKIAIASHEELYANLKADAETAEEGDSSSAEALKFIGETILKLHEELIKVEEALPLINEGFSFTLINDEEPVVIDA